MKTKILIVLCALFFVTGVAFSQNEQIIFNETIDDNSHQGRNYLVVEGLTLTAPFHESSEGGNSWYAKAIEKDTHQPPSKDQNFIRKETVLVEGVGSDDEVTRLSSQDKLTTYEYIDGLGRGMQTVQVAASPKGLDVIQVMEYDVQGRQPKEFLPYVSGTTDGRFVDGQAALYAQSDFYDGTTTPDRVTEDGNPFIQHVFEESPLNRILKTYGAGSEWQSAHDKSTQFKIKTNDSGVVKRWFLNASTLPRYTTTYGADDLILKRTTVDATGDHDDDQITEEYFDGRDLLILKRIKISTSDWLETYYLYNDWGEVIMILPPVLSDINSPNATQVNELAFQYQYDEERRVKAKKLPGTSGWYQFIYDHWGRLVMTLDPVQDAQNQNEYIITKYDRLNRPVYTAKLESSQEVTGWRTDISSNTTDRYESRTGSTDINYTFSVDPVPGQEDVLTVTYYDDYDFVAYLNSGTYFLFTIESGFSGVQQSETKGLVTGSKIKVLGSNPAKWLNTVTYYDEQYRPLQTITENVLGGSDRMTFEYDFAGRVLKSRHVHIEEGSDSELVRVLKEFDYDPQGRLLRTWHTVNNQDKVLMSENQYNEVGQITEKNIHSTNNGLSFLQSLDYTYNIRGWLTHINSTSLSVDDFNDDENDLFAMVLSYTDDYTVNGHTIKPRYDGNISAIQWATDNQQDQVQEQIFGYDYDRANRLKEARYATKSGTNWSGQAGYYDVEVEAYDKNGNILGLNRWAGIDGSRTAIDELTYTYENNGKSNQLYAVVDEQGSFGMDDGYQVVDGNNNPTDADYYYDENGNLYGDLNKGIYDIAYNHMNLPERVTFTGDHYIDFVYDAAGTKLSKIVYDENGSPISRTDYTGSVQYQDGEIEFVHTDEGRIIKTGSTYDYEYFLKDHQGNNRVVVGLLSEVDAYYASMENNPPEIKSQENADFDNLTDAMRLSGSGYNVTPVSEEIPVPNTVANILSGIGPAITLEVSAGDVLDMSVYSGYPISNSNNGAIIGNLAVAVASSFGITPGENPQVYQAFEEFLTGAAAGDYSNSSIPRAYLNYIIISSDFSQEQHGMVELGTGGYQTMDLLSLKTSVGLSGTAYIYVANESSAATASVFFDEFKVIHTKSEKKLQVTQASDFYPFGMKMQPLSYQHEGQNENEFNFQGQELVTDHGLDWHQFKWRNHDAAIGRFFNVDPLAEEYVHNSTYAFSENKVTSHIELEGLEAIAIHGTWSNSSTWEDQKGIEKATNLAFGNNESNFDFNWSGDNLSSARTQAANELVNFVLDKRSSNPDEPISLVGHSHGGNVAIEAANIMANMNEFADATINVLTINTPVREDYQLSDEASLKGNHVNIFDSSDPVQIRGGNNPDKFKNGPIVGRGFQKKQLKAGKKYGLNLTGEHGKANRKFKKAKNIKTSKSHGIFEDFHNSHNKTPEWIPLLLK